MPNPAIRLNENHRRALLAGFRHIDRLLTDGSVGLGPSDDTAIFGLVSPDATPVQKKVIADQIKRVRQAVRKALDACDLAIPPPTVAALWSLQTYLMSVDITLEEMGPKHLVGYGPLDQATADAVRAFQAQIRATVADVQKFVASGSGGDLAARLRRLDHTRDEIRLLAEVERIITERGLVELRPALSVLLEKAEFNPWTVAFVGRVSSGKSSLLNFLLSCDLLPSGITPVTAVPIRIVPGAEVVATVSFALERPLRIPGGRLEAFASEDQNPGNARHVTDILLEIPSTRFSGNVCLVDTPGLGSLATAGAAETLAFLPRCDLGVFLLDCAGTLTEEDVAVMRSLLEGGAEVLVVASKADLLTAEEQPRMLSYLRRQLSESFGRELPVSLVSVAEGYQGEAERWFAETLEPRQHDHERLAADGLRRKVGALREAVLSALIRRQGLTRRFSRATDQEAILGPARSALERQSRRLYDVITNATPRPEAVWEEVAETLAQPSYRSRTGTFDNILAAILARIASRMDNALAKHLEEVRLGLMSAAEQSGMGAEAFPRPAAKPLFDASAIIAASPNSLPWRYWPRWLFRVILRARLAASATDTLEKSVRAYEASLRRWGERYIEELARQFNVGAGLASGAGEIEEESPSIEELERDVALLSHWNQPAEASA
jgi:GTP-binding protein EngB required for normal cell division